LTDPRGGERTRHPFLELLRTCLLLDCQGWHDQLDVTALRRDPAFRLAVSERRGDSPLRPGGNEPDGLCSQPTLSRLLHALGMDANRRGLAEVFLAWAEREVRARPRGLSEATVDLDSLALEVHGHQLGSAYNGHYRVRCFHPIIA